MPNLILQHTNNVEFDVEAFFHPLHEALVATGAVRMKGIKSRCVRLEQFYIADGHPDYKLVHVDIILREGRSQEVKEQISQIVMEHLKDSFGHYRENGYISFSTDMKELIHGLALTDNNIPLDGVPR
ncbi:MAG: 5-carboxymethyl-2-hydroxymuconate Delta-isomerase [Chloroflexota bacterium]